MIRSRAARALLLASMAASADASADRSAAVRAGSVGVEIVTTSGPDRSADWSLQAALSIGGADPGPESDRVSRRE